MAETKKIEDNDYHKFAKIISIISTPAITGSFLLIYMVYNFSPTLDIMFKTLLIVSFFSIILPVFFTVFLLRKDKIKNFHIRERKERAVPFAFALVSSAGSLLAIKYFATNSELIRMVLILYLMALGYVAITLLRFKISGHIFIFSSALLVLAFYTDLRFIYLFPLTILIGWSRVYLKEHTIGEVVGAVGYSIISFVIFSILINN